MAGQIRVGLLVRIIRPGTFYGCKGIVDDADDVREVANVRLDLHQDASTVEEDYDFLEVVDPIFGNCPDWGRS
jgi:hypothetical protein